MFTALKSARQSLEHGSQLRAEAQALRLMLIERSASSALRVAEDVHRATPATVEILQKAAAPAATSSSVGGLMPPTTSFPGFEASMRTASVFDAVSASGATPVPFRTGIGILSAGLTASVVAEGATKVSQSILFSSNGVTPKKVVGLAAATKEVIDGVPAAMESFQRELQGAVASAADASFLTDIAATNSDDAGAPGVGLTDMIADISQLLQMVDVSQRSQLLLAVDIGAGRRMSAEAFGAGHSTMTPLGGRFMGLDVFVSDSLPSATIVLIDATGLAVASTPLVFKTSEEAAIEMATSSSMTSSGPNAASGLTSMFSSNSIAMLSERSIGFAPMRPNSFASLTSVQWASSADSPWPTN